MKTSPRVICDAVAQSLRELAAHPGCLFVTLLALNAIALPYGNLCHDARLYAAQVLNRCYDGLLADDLFFRYGSQDRFSLFSLTVSPLVKAFGIDFTFFALYLIFNALFILALQRLIRTLIEDPLLSTLALVFLMVTPVPFGGMHIFHVNETFLTPRIIANALVLFAMERLLHERRGTALLLLAGAFLMHPLMAMSGLLIWAAWLALDYFRPARLGVLGGLVVAATAVVLLYQPLGLRLFGHMDDAWREQVRRVNPYNFPDQWRPEDRLSIMLSFALAVGGACFFARDARCARLLILITLAAAGGVSMMLIASHLPYALLLQAQPYRALWLLQLLQIPLALVVAARCWTVGTLLARMVTLAVVIYLGMRSFSATEAMVLLAALPVCIVVWHGLRRTPRTEDWLWRSLLTSCCLGVVGWILFKVALVLGYWNRLTDVIHPMEMVRIFFWLVDPICWMALLLLVVYAVWRRAGAGVGYATAMLGAALVTQSFFFGVPLLRPYAERYVKYHQDVRFLAEFLDRHHERERGTPTVYWPVARTELLWFDVRANGYFDWTQVVGNLFSRQNALEGHRRALLVKRFEMERFRQEEFMMPDHARKTFLSIFETDENERPPSWDDFWTLCQEEGVDYLVLRQKYSGLHIADNGTFFIYDCKQIRSGQRSPDVGNAGHATRTRLSNPKESHP